MTSQEFKELRHGDKVYQGGRNFIVHNNHRGGTGMVVVVRTEVIRGCDCEGWTIAKKYEPVCLTTLAGTYEVQVVRRIDNDG